MIVLIMGIAGSGKTTVGQRLAASLGWPFFDADDLHPAANIAKMASGQPLDDADRAPWLERLRQLIDAQVAAGASAVLACSALKRSYRERLLGGCAGARLVYLQASRALLAVRLRERAHHFFPAALLDSQLAALEEPDGEPGGEPEDAPEATPEAAPEATIVIDAGLPVDDIVAAIRAALARAPGLTSG